VAAVNPSPQGQQETNFHREMAAIYPEAQRAEGDPLFPPAPWSQYENALDWREINPLLKQPMVLIRAPAPWRLVFNFSQFDASDEAQFDIDFETSRPSKGKSAGFTDWVHAERHRVGRTHVNIDGHPVLHLAYDGEPIATGVLLIVEAPEIPLVARLIYNHVRSSQRIVRYARLP
jgi:hypothetical protein